METFDTDATQSGMPRGRLLPSRRGLARAAAVGLAAGALWGVAARVWMRLITTETPSFSWSGSAFIVALAAAFGLVVGVAAQARREGRSRWWLLVAVPGLALFAGPGTLFLPAFVIGGIALRVALGAEGAITGQPWSARRVVGLLAAVVAVCVVPVIGWRADRLDEVTMLSAPTHVQLAELLLMPVLGLWLAWHGRSLWWGVRPGEVQAGRRS